MNEEQKYTTLSERLNQDVIHDNFVPKYSALATAQPTKLILVGVWLIFGPMALGIFALPFHFFVNGSGPFASILSSLLATLFGALSVMILFSQTKRFLHRHDASPGNLAWPDADKTFRYWIAQPTRVTSKPLTSRDTSRCSPESFSTQIPHHSNVVLIARTTAGQVIKFWGKAGPTFAWPKNENRPYSEAIHSAISPFEPTITLDGPPEAPKVPTGDKTTRTGDKCIVRRRKFMTDNPYSSPTTADTTIGREPSTVESEESIAEVAKPVFIAWERLRVLYVVLLGVFINRRRPPYTTGWR